MNKRQKLVQERFLDNEEAVIKSLEKVYGTALEDITKKAQALQDDINRLGTLAKLATDEDEKAQILSMQQAKVYQKQYQDALKKQVGSILDNMQVEEFKTVSGYLQTCYEDAFVGTMFDLQGQGIPLCFPLDQESMVRAVQLDSKISEGLYNYIGENVADLKKHITSEVARGIATGAAFSDIARQLRTRMTGDYNKAGGALYRSKLIARTEGHRIQCQATMDACHKAKEKGADVVKQWDATLDAKTRDSHARVDGEIRELDKPFSNGLMFPGDPGGGAAEVCNCRCALLQRARWALDEDELKTLQDRAAHFGLDKSDTFEEYKKNYLKAAENMPEFTAKSTFVPAKTIEEAEDFIRKYVDEKQFGALGVSYKGISVETANKVNEVLTGVYETFDFDRLGGVFVAKGNTKIGKMVDGATAAYSPIRKSLILNNRAMKNVGDIAQSHAEELELVKMFIADPSSVVCKTKRAETVLRLSVKSRRATVPDSIDDVIHHELGHSLERVVKGSDKYSNIVANMPKYAEKISGYAAYDEGEYIAESFASLMKGEKLVDPDLVTVFDSLKKKPGKTIAKNAKSGIIPTERKQLSKFSSKDIETVVLPKQEYAHVMSELATHMSEAQKRQPIVKKAIGNHVYTVENNGFGNYRIIGKKPINGIDISDEEWGE